MTVFTSRSSTACCGALFSLSAFILILLVGAPSAKLSGAEQTVRSIYTYSFGGLENMEPRAAVELLDGLGSAGLAVEGRSEESLKRMDAYYALSEQDEYDFKVFYGYMAHRFDKYGFDDAGHRAAIDRLSPHQGTLWVWVRDAEQDGSITDERVEQFIRGILDYAITKEVKIILYPHYNTYFPTTKDALRLVNKIDSPSLGIAINLCHELMSDRGPELTQTFALAQDRLAAVILSGSLIELDRTDVRTMNASTILSLDESVFDLKPFVQLIKDSGFKGPVGFINFKPQREPADYLQRTMMRWRELCAEVGLYN